MSYQTIYDTLRAAGLTMAGALGLMGNWDCESNCEPCRVQGDFQSDRSASKSYAAAVDSGRMARSTFEKDAKGWGLAQWTYWSRKSALYDWCKNRSASIADEAAQVSFAVHELKTGYSDVWSFLTSAKDDQMFQAADMVCRKYERPAYNNVSARFNAAKRIEGIIDTSSKPKPKPDPSPDPAPVGPDTPTTPFWPPRMLDSGMVGSDVAALQALLIARGFSVRSISGIFDASTRTAADRFQQGALGKTGAFGPNSWAALLKTKG